MLLIRLIILLEAPHLIIENYSEKTNTAALRNDARSRSRLIGGEGLDMSNGIKRSTVSCRVMIGCSDVSLSIVKYSLLKSLLPLNNCSPDCIDIGYSSGSNIFYESQCEQNIKNIAIY
jgi:hypothetical protein